MLIEGSLDNLSHSVILKVETVMFVETSRCQASVWPNPENELNAVNTSHGSLKHGCPSFLWQSHSRYCGPVYRPHVEKLQ